MDLNEFRSFISDSGVDVWTWIDMAISVASADHENELRNRRDEIVQKLYALPLSRCENCEQRNNDDEEEHEQAEILEIKNLLDDHTQNEDCLIDLLQRLVDMNTTFKTLKETEIGRHVTKLRKHSSNEVRRLVKVLVRKWKDTVDEWVRHNTPEEEANDFIGNRKSYDESINHNSTPTKRKSKDRDYQESQHETEKRRAQVNGISKVKNSIIPNNGGSVPIKY